MPGARRTHCLACKTKRTHAGQHGTPKSLRHSLRNGFTASPCSPGEPVFLATIACEYLPQT